MKYCYFSYCNYAKQVKLLCKSYLLKKLYKVCCIYEYFCNIQCD